MVARILKQYGITSVRQCGEGRSFEITSELHNRMCCIKTHLGDFEIQDIINANETALFYKTVSLHALSCLKSLYKL
jgi:hypothetical protein